jgi:Uma2 family endonuclease
VTTSSPLAVDSYPRGKKPDDEDGTMDAMAFAKSRPRKTMEDLMALPDEVRAELIHGELLVTPTPRVPHQRVLGRLYRLLDDWVRAAGSGEVLLSPMDVHLPSGDVVEPDLIYVSADNLDICQDWVRGVPDLLVEIVSPSHPERDRLVKRELYARNAVPAFWIVDPDEQSIELLRLDGHVYAPEAYLTGANVLETSSFPGLRVSLHQVFEAR